MPFGLGVRDRKDHALAQFFVRLKEHLDYIAVEAGGSAPDLRRASGVM
jgi:hypothetical protein